MSRFPLFIDLYGRKAVIVGGGVVGLRRAEVLYRFGAEVTVVSPHLHHQVPGIRWLAKDYAPGDLEGAFLAVAATDSRCINASVEAEARSKGILFNISDSPEDCDFFFPAICQGAGLTAGVVGDGSDHHKTARAAALLRQTLQSMEESL